jgi:hypothetical protein
MPADHLRFYRKVTQRFLAAILLCKSSGRRSRTRGSPRSRLAPSRSGRRAHPRHPDLQACKELIDRIIAEGEAIIRSRLEGLLAA